MINDCIRPPRWRRVVSGIARWLVVLARVPWYPIRVLVRAERCRTGRHEGIFGTCEWCGAAVATDFRIPLVRRTWPALVATELAPMLEPSSPEAEPRPRWATFTIDYSYPPPTPPLWRRAGRAVRAALLRWSR